MRGFHHHVTHHKRFFSSTKTSRKKSITQLTQELAACIFIIFSARAASPQLPAALRCVALCDPSSDGNHALVTWLAGARAFEVRLNCSSIAGRFDLLPLSYWGYMEAVGATLEIQRWETNCSDRLQYSGVSRTACTSVTPFMFLSLSSLHGDSKNAHFVTWYNFLYINRCLVVFGEHCNETYLQSTRSILHLTVPVCLHYTGCANKKQPPWCMITTSANMDRFSKLFHQLIRKKILHVYDIDFHLNWNVLLHYLVKFENPTLLLIWQHPQQTIDMFLRTLWGLDLTCNSS